MNREILFRGKFQSLQQFAKPINEGQWVYGDLVRKAIFYCNSYNDAIYTNGEAISVDPDTVGQFTELVDKNGVKIFEGDIVLWDRDQKMYVVVFRNGMYYASVEECNPHIYGGFPLWYLCEQEQQCTIAGNIYDNPELLATK